jgi:DoxX-like protein
MSTLAALFLIMDGVMKLMKPAFVVQATVQLGYPESVIIGLGIVLLACTVLYLIPRTAVLGAILLTGYLGGAVATHVRIGDPLFSHTLFPVYLAVLLWGGLCLRDPRLFVASQYFVCSYVIFSQRNECDSRASSMRPDINWMAWLRLGGCFEIRRRRA